MKRNSKKYKKVAFYEAEMQSKLALVNDVHTQVTSLESEKQEIGKALVESTKINSQLKKLCQDKDKIIEKMHSEMEKFASIKNEIEPLIKETGELRKQVETKDKEIEGLNQSLAQATKIVEQVPNIEMYVKQAAGAIKEMSEENMKLKEQVNLVHKS